jgi:formate dehydrogenase subunit delta
MEEENMIHMANQIAMFFESYPRAEAVDGVLDHFRSFWEPRMRKQIIEYVAAGGHGLHALAIEAVKRLAPVSA